MSYTVRYRIPAKSVIGELWHADIEEENYAGGVTELHGNAAPIKIKYSDNTENKYPPIQASYCTLSFVSDSFNLETFISTDDKKYRVSIYKDGTSLQWRGFLSTDDCSEAFISGPREFVLTATDGLGFLKEESYKFRTGESGKDAYQKRLLLDVIADCLHYTYTELNLYLQCNVYEQTMDAVGGTNPFDQCKVHTKLLIYADQGPRNMYDVLETIMQSFNCTLFQQFGEWHVKRKPDAFDTDSETNKLYVWPTLTPEAATRRWYCQRGQDFTAINASHLLSFVKPVSYSKVIHNYILPEIPMNSNFGRGGLIAATSTENEYEVDFWSCVDATLGSGNPVVSGFVRREEFDVNGNISDSFAVIPAGIPELAELRSEEVKVNKGDYINVSGMARLNQIVASFGQGILYIILTPDSGPVADYYFVAATGSAAANWDPLNGFPAVSIGSGDGIASDQWHAFDITTLPFPADGTLQLRLRSFYANPAMTGLECHVKDFRTNYTLSFNGAEIGVIGEQSTSNLNITSRKTYEQSIRLGDSPKRVIASSLWRATDDTQLTTGWGRLADPTYDASRLIEINSEDLQKSLWRVFKKVDGDYMGIQFESPAKLIGPGNLFIFFPPDNVSYVPTNIEIDIINNQWTASMQEFNDSRAGGADVGATFYNSTEFKYLFNERS